MANQNIPDDNFGGSSEYFGGGCGCTNGGEDVSGGGPYLDWMIAEAQGKRPGLGIAKWARYINSLLLGAMVLLSIILIMVGGVKFFADPSYDWITYILVYGFITSGITGALTDIGLGNDGSRYDLGFENEHRQALNEYGRSAYEQGVTASRNNASRLRQ